jgi:hypothetical protein
MWVAICVTVVLANLRMGPPVNLTLISNSTTESAESHRAVPGFVDHVPRRQRMRIKEAEKTNYRAGSRAKEAV